MNPFGPVNATFRDLATSHGLSTAQQARLFAMTSMSSADALIDCFNKKDFYNFWRPQTAIQEAATDGNPNTAADTTWESKFPTPGYPDMPSGYNCYTAAMMNAGKAFFGTDNVSFDVTNSSPPGATPGSRATSATRSTVGSSSASTSGAPTSRAPGSARRPPSGWPSTSSGPSH